MSPGGKNIQDHHGAVHHLGVQCRLQVLKLGGAQLVVADHAGGVKLPDQILDLLDLTLAQIRARVHLLAVLNHLVHGHGSGRFHQLRQLL